MISDYRAAGPIETRQRKYRSVLIGNGWCNEVHRIAEASLHLVNHGYGHEVLILLRTMFETTISLHWLLQKGDAGARGCPSREAARTESPLRTCGGDLKCRRISLTRSRVRRLRRPTRARSSRDSKHSAMRLTPRGSCTPCAATSVAMRTPVQPAPVSSSNGRPSRLVFALSRRKVLPAWWRPLSPCA
ncbi:DUF5677 domain-containing protein [Streptomyces sp. NPDC057137]|uniref:DUF5677 domain-containing protein n=1 Tax=Streptomyces sp. NPDC057137 TaxID=3346030 RepID=UPI0036322CCB